MTRRWGRRAQFFNSDRATAGRRVDTGAELEDRAAGYRFDGEERQRSSYGSDVTTGTSERSTDDGTIDGNYSRFDRQRQSDSGDVSADGIAPSRSVVEDGNASVVEPVDKRILITGGAGFIGSHLAERLAANNDVVVIDNFATGLETNVGEDVDLVEGDITNADLVTDTATDTDIVVHLAAMMGVRRTLENPLDVLRVNMEGTKNVLSAAAENDVERVLFASTSEVYGDLVEPPFRENDAMSPKTNYAVAKLADERYLQAFCEDAGIPYTIVRYFNVYGSRQEGSEYGYVVPRFVEHAENDEPLPVHGDGAQTRDFTYIDDAVDATVRSLGEAGVDETFNVGTGEEVSIAELARTVVDVVGSGTVEFVEHPRPYRVEYRCADTSKTERLLGYAPSVDLESGIERLTDTM